MSLISKTTTEIPKSFVFTLGQKQIFTSVHASFKINLYLETYRARKSFRNLIVFSFPLIKVYTNVSLFKRA